jgi:hypothetical protein
MNKFFFISFLLYFILIFQIPSFIGDEGYYSISITEAINNGIKPYMLFFELPAFWKPPLMINVYALIAIPLIEIFNMDIVYAYRFGSVIFTALNVILVYLISTKFVDKEKAKWITIIFALNPVVLIYGTKIFMETMSITFVLLGILGAIKFTEKNENVWLGLIPLSIFGAAYTKSYTIGLMSILLCGLYFVIFNLKKIDKFIISTLVGVLICIIFAQFSGFPEIYYDLFMEDFFTTRMQYFYIENFFNTLSTQIYLLPIFIMGWKKIDWKNKKDLFMIIWLIPLIPIMLKTPFVWYAFYFILPLAYLAVKCIDIKGIDLIVLMFLICIGLFIGHSNFEGHNKNVNFEIQKYFDENISKESCIIVMGAPEMMMYSYLYHNDYNFNFVLSGGFNHSKEESISTHTIPKEKINEYRINYLSNYDDCIEQKEYLYLSISVENNYFRSCREKCSKPEYILISATPEVDIKDCYIIKKFDNLNLWKC